MTVFIMDEESAAQLHALAKAAEENRYDVAYMTERARRFEAGETVEDFSRRHGTRLATGFTVTYTIEEHPQRDGSGGQWLRHVSVASPRDGRAPTGMVLEYVMGQLGFTTPLGRCQVYVEELGKGRIAVNVIDAITDNAPASQAVN